MAGPVRRFGALLSCVAVALAWGGAGQAQTAGWNLYSNYTQSYTIPFVPGGAPNYATNNTAMFVSASFNGSPAVNLQVDTGSQGVVIPQYLLPNFQQSPNLQTIRYSTSGNYAVGTWTTVVMTFPNSVGPNGAVARATIPVFVEETSYDSQNRATNCTTAATGANCFHMMGVGFGRPDNGWGPDYLPSLVNNPLLHITGMDEGTVRAGYILTPTGIQAGLTAANTSGNFAFLKLLQTQIPGQAGTQYATPSGSITATNQAGVSTSGSAMILMDTGINYWTGGLPVTVRNGDTYVMTVDLLGGAGFVGYQVSASGASINSGANMCGSQGLPACYFTPWYFDVNTDRKDPFINLGVHSMAGFNYLFDAAGGYLGLSANGNASGAFVNPAFITQGPIQFTAPFYTNLPVYVMGATSIGTTSGAQFAASVSGPAPLAVTQGQVTFSGGMTLPAGLTVSGGTVTLAGQVTAPVTVAAAGELVNYGALAGTLANAGLTANGGSITGAVTTSGYLTNDGSITGAVANSGVLLNGGTLTGAVTNRGSIANTGVIAGSVTNTGVLNNNGTVLGSVSNSGTLSGNGRVTGDVSGSGRYAPGNSIGTLSVGGNLTFAPGAVYAAEFAGAGQSDQILVAGTATIAPGTTLLLTAGVGAGPAIGTYTVLQANGGVVGQFTTVTDPFGTLYPFLDVAATTTANAVLLNVSIDRVALSNGGATPNEKAVAATVGALPDANPLVPAVAVLQAGQVPGALNALSGEIYASSATVFQQQAFYGRDAVLARLRQSPGAVGGPAAAPLAPGLPATAWVQGYGAWANVDGTGNTSAVSSSLGGAIGGLDLDAGGAWRLGIAGGFGQSTYSASALNSNGSADSYNLGLYAGGPVGDLRLALGGLYAWHDVTVSRFVSFPGFSNAVSSDPQAQSGQVFAEIGRDLALGAATLTPYAGLAYVHFALGDLTEIGGPAALASPGYTQSNTLTTLGARIAQTLPFWGGQLTGSGSLGWQYAFGDLDPAASFAFASGSAPFTVTGAPFARNTALIGVGLDYRAGPAFVLGISYGGQFSDTGAANTVSGRLSITF